MRPKVKQYPRDDQRSTQPVSASQISHLVCPGCHKRNIHITNAGQQKVNPDFKDAYQSGRNTTGIPKYIYGDPMVTCKTPGCKLYDQTLDLKSLLKMIGTGDLGQYKTVKTAGATISTKKCRVCGEPLYSFSQGDTQQYECHNSKDYHGHACPLFMHTLTLNGLNSMTSAEINKRQAQANMYAQIYNKSIKKLDLELGLPLRYHTR